jgi:hypothetical protein
MRRQACDMLRVLLFATPAAIDTRLVGQGHIATWAIPFDRRHIRHLLRNVLQHLCLVPFSHASIVQHDPADGTGPDFVTVSDFAGANGALVQQVGNVLMDPCWQVWRC